MTEPRRLQSPTGRIVEHKAIPLTELKELWATHSRQAALYFEAYRQVLPMPAGLIEVNYDQVEQGLMKHYSLRDAEFTLDWRRLYGGPSPYPNKLRAKNDQVQSAAELLHWDTVMSMASPPLRVTVVPDFGCDCRFRCR